jgi:hypothetical protein
MTRPVMNQVVFLFGKVIRCQQGQKKKSQRKGAKKQYRVLSTEFRVRAKAKDSTQRREDAKTQRKAKDSSVSGRGVKNDLNHREHGEHREKTAGAISILP